MLPSVLPLSVLCNFQFLIYIIKVFFHLFFLPILIIHNSICILTESLSDQCGSYSAMDFWAFSKVKIYLLPWLFSVITVFYFVATVPSRVWRHRHLTSSPKQMTSTCTKDSRTLINSVIHQKESLKLCITLWVKKQLDSFCYIKISILIVENHHLEFHKFRFQGWQDGLSAQIQMEVNHHNSGKIAHYIGTYRRLKKKRK